MHLDYPKLKLTLKQVLLLNLIFVLLYVLAGSAGLLFATFNIKCSPFWPPSGIALAAVLLFGMRNVLPGIVLGVVGIAFIDQPTLIPTLGLVFASVAESLIASTLLHSVGKGRFQFKTPKDILSFINIAVILGPFLSSTIAMLVFYLHGILDLDQLPRTWITFLIGNSLGILVFTPFILSLFDQKNKKANVAELAVLLTSLICLGWFSFSEPGMRRFTLVPLFLWATLRFSFKGVSISTLTLSLIAIIRSTFIEGVFDTTSAEADLLWIQWMTAGTAILGYFLATVIEVHEDAQVELSLNQQHKKIAEEALAIMDQSINKSPIGFALIGKDYKYIRVNEMLAKINGYSSEYHKGKTIREIVPEVADDIERMVDRVFSSGISFMNNYFHGVTVNGGAPYSGMVSYYPIKHPSTNKIFSVGIIIQDMTQQLRIQSLLQEKQEFLSFAQGAGKIGSFEWDLQTKRVIWTNELESIYGLNEGEFGGNYESWLQWIHPDDVDLVKKTINNVLSSDVEANVQFRIITKNQDIKWILTRGKKVTDRQNHTLRFIGINIDITEQKTIEHKLRVTEANLLHALSVRDEFVAIASHELKTPLTSLKLQTQLLQRGLEKNSYSQEKVLSNIEKNASHIDRLTRLVDDMLDISRIRTGKLTIKKESCELSSMLQDILLRLSDQFDSCAGGHPEVEHLEEVYGEWDPLRIEQVMTNLITNAIRYGQGKKIFVSVQNMNDFVRFSVRDQGLGIAKSDQQKIFKRYERGMLQREISGLGIGLFITQQIVHAHKGEIWLESTIGQGTTFYVDLPLEKSTLLKSVTQEANLLMV